MLNSPSFSVYPGLGSETAAAQIDMREVRRTIEILVSAALTHCEQFDFGTTVTQQWKHDDPFWKRLEGASEVRSCRDLRVRRLTNSPKVPQRGNRDFCETV